MSAAVNFKAISLRCASRRVPGRYYPRTFVDLDPIQWHKEKDVHLLVASWLDVHPKTSGAWFHCPNGGTRNKSEARMLRMMGVKPGVPDIIVLCRGKFKRRVYPCAAIELKSAGNRDVQESQRGWLEFLDGLGWFTAVCRGADAAVGVLGMLYGVPPHLPRIDRTPRNVSPPVRPDTQAIPF